MMDTAQVDIAQAPAGDAGIFDRVVFIPLYLVSQNDQFRDRAR